MMEVTRDYVTVVAVEGSSAEEYVTVLSVGCGAPDGAEDVLVYRLPGERLGFGLKFEGGTSTSEKVRRLFIQSCAPDSPASRAHCSWGSLQEGDEVLQIDAVPVTAMTRLDCVRSLKESHVVIKLLVRHPAPPPIPPRRKTLGPPIAFADVPPEPEVYLDLLAQEELSCLTDTGSDDTGSSISTVLGPFDQLEEEALQPPLSFQDAPLSYSDERVLPPKPAPRKDVQARFRSGKKRPPPPPPPRKDRPQCPLNVQTVAVVETDRGDLPRLVDVVPKAALETEEVMQGSALPQEVFTGEERPVRTDWEENRSAVTENGSFVASREEATSTVIVTDEEENTSEVKEDKPASAAGNEESRLVAADEEDSRHAVTGNGYVPARSGSEDTRFLVTEIPAEGDSKVLLDVQENGFLGTENEEYKSVEMQNQKSMSVAMSMREDRPVSIDSNRRNLMDRAAGAESRENSPVGTVSKQNRHLEGDSKENSPVATCSSENRPTETGSRDNRLPETANKENSHVVTGGKENRLEGTDSQEHRIGETGMKKNRPVVTYSNGHSSVLCEDKENRPVVTNAEDKSLLGNKDERQRSQVPDIGDDRSVEARLRATHMEENRQGETGMRGNRDMDKYEHSYGRRNVETVMKENRNVETGMKGNRPVENGVEQCNLVGTESKENCHVVIKNKQNKLVETESVENISLMENGTENSFLQTDRKDNGPVLTDSIENRPLVIQYVEKSLVVSGNIENGSAGTVSSKNSPVAIGNEENSSGTPQNNETGLLGIKHIEKSPVATKSVDNHHAGTNNKENSPVIENEEFRPVVFKGKETNLVVTKNMENSPAGTANKENSNIVIKNKENSLVVCESKFNRPVETPKAGTLIEAGRKENEPVRDRNEDLADSLENSPVECKSFGTGSDKRKENRPVETEHQGNSVAITGTTETDVQDVGVSSKLCDETDCVEVLTDVFMVAVPQMQYLHSDSDEDDFLMDLPETELLEQGGTVFQPATGALLTASDATFFPFRCWGPTSHLATIGEDEEEDLTNQGAPGLCVVSGDKTDESKDHVDTNPVLSAESRLDNLVQSAGESKPGPECEEETPAAGSEGPESAADVSDAVVTSLPVDGDTAMEESPLTSSASRLPPDGHEFPPNYTEHNPFTVGSPALIELELEKTPPPLPASGPPPRKFSIEELRSPVRVPAWRKDEKSECSVKDKIAMFSAAGDAPTPRRRFSSSEDICIDSRPPPRPPPPELLPKKTSPPTIDRTHSSLDLSHVSGMYFSTLPRKPAAHEGSVRPSTLTHTASLHTRSQSLIDIGRGTVEDVRKASLNALIEQRRRGISKLRGLVIPEKVSEIASSSHPICDLPEIRSRDSILTSNKAPPATPLQRSSTNNRWSMEQTTISSAPQLVIPSPPWKSSSSTNILPKYSPAFKRKSLTVYGSTGPGQEELQPLFPICRHSAEAPASLESITSPTRSDLSFEYKLSTANKGASAPGCRPVEDDSDNDSAVSSSRSSISPPPTPPPPPLLSPLRRTLSSETTVSAASSTTSTLTCGSSDSNRRVLKAQSVEAINRKNVLSSARYSSGRDLKVGSPLIQRKFDEDEHVVYLDEVEGHADEEEEEELDKLPEEQPPAKPLPAPRHVPVPPKPVQRKLQEASPEEETDLLSVLTGGRGSQMRRQRSKDSVLGDSRRSVSVNDIRKAFEKAEMALANSGRKVNHARVSSLDSTASEDSFTPHSGSVGNLHREQFGSVTSIASSTSLISPQELQLLIDEANQPLEDSVSTTAMPVHDVVVVVLHREGTTGSVGITLAGGADYEAKEITVHKVLAGSPADRDGRIQKGDRILSINGRSMKGVTHHESLNILKAPRPEVVLVVSCSKVPQDGNHDGPQLDDCPVATHIPRSSRPPRIPEQPLESVTDPLVTTEEEDRGPPLTIMLTKDGAGLGFSLEGGKDSPLGDKPLTIKKIFTGGSAEKNGQLRAGDELLSVNGSDVTVLSRIEAWGLMKRLPDGPVALTVRHRLNK